MMKTHTATHCMHSRPHATRPQEEATIAIELLQNLTKHDAPRWPLGQLNPKPLKACRVRQPLPVQVSRSLRHDCGCAGRVLL